MAGFFNLPSSRATTKKDQQLLKKVASPVKSSSTVTLKGSTKLIDRIQAITSFVKSKFAVLLITGTSFFNPFNRYMINTDTRINATIPQITP